MPQYLKFLGYGDLLSLGKFGLDKEEFFPDEEHAISRNGNFIPVEELPDTVLDTIDQNDNEMRFEEIEDDFEGDFLKDDDIDDDIHPKDELDSKEEKDLSDTKENFPVNFFSSNKEISSMSSNRISECIGKKEILICQSHGKRGRMPRLRKEKKKTYEDRFELIQASREKYFEFFEF